MRTNQEMEKVAKQMLYGEDARRKLLEGIDAVANAVKVTLGPAARTRRTRKELGQSDHY